MKTTIEIAEPLLRQATELASLALPRAVDPLPMTAPR